MYEIVKKATQTLFNILRRVKDISRLNRLNIM